MFQSLFHTCSIVCQQKTHLQGQCEKGVFFPLFYRPCLPTLNIWYILKYYIVIYSKYYLNFDYQLDYVDHLFWVVCGIVLQQVCVTSLFCHACNVALFDCCFARNVGSDQQVDPGEWQQVCTIRSLRKGGLGWLKVTENGWSVLH